MKRAGKPNQIPKTNASSKIGRGRRRDKDAGSQRSAETIKRLNMYKDRPIRNKAGKIVSGNLIMKDRAGDRRITAATGRIEPDRRWFGNTRTVDPKDLDAFRKEMTEAVSDPYSVVLKRKKLPMGLLQEAAEYSTSNHKAILEQESFETTFGKHKQRKRVKLDQLFQARSLECKRQHQNKNKSTEGVAKKPAERSGDNEYAALLQTAQTSQEFYQDINAQEGIVPWGRDKSLDTTGEGVDWRHEKKADLFLKGQSKRIWGEFFKVVDCSDVILHIIDARNVPGTRCTMIERHIAENAKHKHLVFILNKIDLVPNWVAKRWMGELAKDRPTIAFHASLTHAFGKGALISLLRQFGKLHSDKKQISVGVVGYPNVGKSSVINTLISKKSCKVAPIPGETKIWQYITLFKRISLIDCPGVVVDTAGDTETDSVLKGVVRAERLEHPEDFVDAICEAVKPEHIRAQYKLGKQTWGSSVELCEMIARKCGRLRKGGDPCLRSASILIINDFQRGRLPHYVAPPELKTDDDATTNAKSENITQDLEQIGQESNVSEGNEEAKEESNSGNQEDTSEGNDQSTESPSHQDDQKSEKSPCVEQQSAAALIGSGDWDD